MQQPFYQQVLAVVKETQDNNTLTEGDEYSEFLINIIKKNCSTETPEQTPTATVDIENLALDLKYTLDQFAKALQAVERFAI